MSRQAIIEEKRMSMKTTQQGGGSQGMQKVSEKGQYTGSMRQKLNIDNPLLNEISLVYLGLKKVKPLPISILMGSAINTQIYKK
jgi:hypothetical protein